MIEPRAPTANHTLPTTVRTPSVFFGTGARSARSSSNTTALPHARAPWVSPFSRPPERLIGIVIGPQTRARVDNTPCSSSLTTMCATPQACDQN